MLTRYELCIDNEYQGVGICHGVDALDLDEEVKRKLLEPFDQKLHIPEFHTNVPCCSFFTGLGDAVFKQYIDKLKNAYQQQGLFDVKTIRVYENTFLETYVLYADRFQVVVRDGTFKRN